MLTAAPMPLTDTLIRSAKPDMARYRDSERVNYIIQNWMRNRNTIEFLGLWEQLNNSQFKSIEFDAFRNQAGLNSFALTPKLWVEKTAAVGIVSKAGRYGGTYAHKDRQLAEVLSGGEIDAIIRRINKTGNANERTELAAKLQGILDERSSGAVGQYPVTETGFSGGARGESVGDAQLSSRVSPEQLGGERGHSTYQETARSVRDRSDTLGGLGGEQAAGGQPERFSINFSRIDAPEDVKTVIQNMADGYRADIDAARRGVRTFEQTALSAEQENAWKILAERRTGQPLNAEQSLAARNLWASSGQKLSELAEIAAKTPTEENLFAFRKMLEVHRAVQNEVIAARTETARALGSVSSFRQASQRRNGKGSHPSLPELIAHPDILLHRRRAAAEKDPGKYLGIPEPALALLQSWPLRLLRKPLQLTKNLLYLGEIPRKYPETQALLGEIARNGVYETDRILDDSALAYVHGKGKNKALTVITGCAHSGIINTIEHAKAVTGVSRIHAVIGGMHMKDASKVVKQRTLHYFAEQNIEMLRGCHCTGNALEGVANKQRCIQGTIWRSRKWAEVPAMPPDPEAGCFHALTVAVMIYALKTARSSHILVA